MRLPYPFAHLVDRRDELAQLRDLVLDAGNRVITLTGPNGIGKTRLAIALGQSLTEAFPDGIALVLLSDADDPSLVIPSIAHVVDIWDDSDQRLRDRLRQRLRQLRVLLILDNFDGVLEAGPLLSELCASCPDIAIVVTSDTALGIPEERSFPLQPLTLPAVDAAIDAIRAADAVTLFLQIAEQASPGYVLTDDNADAIASICRLLLGIPLPIELVAARIACLTPHELLREIETVTRAVDATDAAALLHAILDWSVALLTPAERELFRRLAVFVGGCIMDAIAAVCAEPGTDAAAVERDIATLHEARLLRRWVGSQDLTYVRLIAAIRSYAVGQLQASGGATAIRDRHAVFYTEFAELSEPHLVRPEQMLWYERLEDERDNFRAALRWLIDTEQAELGLRLGAALWRFWDRRGYNSEGRVWLSELLAIPRGMRASLQRTTSLFGAGRLSYQQGDFQIARMLLEESLWTAREIKSDLFASGALTQLGHIATRHGQFAQAKRYYEESLALRRAVGYQFGIVISLHSLGSNAHHLGDFDTARRLILESMVIAREIGYIDGIGKAYDDLAMLEVHADNPAVARQHARRAIEIHRTYDDRLYEGLALHALGHVSIDDGQPVEGREYFLQALAIYEDSGTRDRLITAFEALVEAFVGLADPARALRLAAAATQFRKSGKFRIDSPGQERLNRFIALARLALSDAEADAAWESGTALSIQETIAEVHQPIAPSIPTSSSALPMLTRRERDVLRLLVEGRANQQIADDLFISINTVKRHITHLFAKLDATSRGQAIANARDMHLL